MRGGGADGSGAGTTGGSATVAVDVSDFGSDVTSGCELPVGRLAMTSSADRHHDESEPL